MDFRRVVDVGIVKLLSRWGRDRVVCFFGGGRDTQKAKAKLRVQNFTHTELR